MSAPQDQSPGHQAPTQPYSPPPAPASGPMQPYPSGIPLPYGPPQAIVGPIGRTRSTGMVILLSIVTLGIYAMVYYYSVFDEMKRHSGEGLGGAVGLILSFFVGVVTTFILPAEVGRLYERRGQHSPVTVVTGLWCLVPLVGGIVWLVKTNGALNAYWRSLGAA